ncbi:hypothetical protein [Tenacibaculum piscium]|uniref:hypothetical protein n=1 Tax=Tenacibaculum piscium TaxID=1458515 RepID=UPI001F3A2C55|nr:hypothetical protein [Tenacibaculum piscium]
MITPLNVSGNEFCKRLGISQNATIMQCFRNLELVNFFKVGKKYMYPFENIEKVNQMLINNEISIKSDKGYYITLNKKVINN